MFDRGDGSGRGRVSVYRQRARVVSRGSGLQPRHPRGRADDAHGHAVWARVVERADEARRQRDPDDQDDRRLA